MCTELLNSPGVIITSSGIKRTTKVKEFVEKNKLDVIYIKYADCTGLDFKGIERLLQSIENEITGVENKIKENVNVNYVDVPKFVKRINSNTVIIGYDKESFDDLCNRYINW